MVDFIYTCILSKGWWPKLNRLGFESIELQDISWLERPFEEMEVHSLVKSMVKNKAPGPDGFSMVFFQTSCVVLKEA